jgi:integrase
VVSLGFDADGKWVRREVRSKEAQALTWEHMDLETGTISVWRSVRTHGNAKTNRSRRTLKLPEIAVEALREQQGAAGSGAGRCRGVAAGARAGVHHVRGDDAAHRVGECVGQAGPLQTWFESFA